MIGNRSATGRARHRAQKSRARKRRKMAHVGPPDPVAEARIWAKERFGNEAKDLTPIEVVELHLEPRSEE